MSKNEYDEFTVINSKFLDTIKSKFLVKWKHNNDKLAIIGNKKITFNKKEDHESIWIAIQNLFDQQFEAYKNRKEKGLYVARLNNSDLRFVFNNKFVYVDVLTPNQFVTFTVRGKSRYQLTNKDFLQILNIDKDDLAKLSRVYLSDEQFELTMTFKCKKKAMNEFFKINGQDFRSNRDKNERIKFSGEQESLVDNNVSKCLVEMVWSIWKSALTATVSFHNEEEADFAQQNIKNAEKVLHNPKQILIKRLKIHQDEQSIESLLQSKQISIWSEIKVNRMKGSKEEDEEVAQTQFSQFLQKHHLTKYKQQALFDKPDRGLARVRFEVESIKEANKLIIECNNQENQIGFQKVRVKLLNMQEVTVSVTQFNIQKEQYDILKARALYLYSQFKISFTEAHHNEKQLVIQVDSNAKQICDQVAMQLGHLFTQGYSVKGVQTIVKNDPDWYAELKQRFQDVAMFKDTRFEWRLLAKNQEVVDEIQKLLNKKVIELKKKKKWGKKNIKVIGQETCQICYEEKKNQLIKLDCNHTFCDDCLKQHVHFKSEQVPYNKEIYCPQQNCKSGLKLSLISEIMKDELQVCMQTRMLNFINSKENKYRTYGAIKGCWTPDCPMWFMFEKQLRQKCNYCDHEWCLKFQKQIFATPQKLKEHHTHPDNVKCIDMQDSKKLDELLEDLVMPMGCVFKKQWLKSQFDDGQIVLRRCPDCKMLIEHNGACMHIKCKCGAHMCFLCGFTPKGDIYKHLEDEHQEKLH